MNAPSISTQLANPFSKWFDPHPKLENKSLMDHLYSRLDGLYPQKWRANFNGPESIENWSVVWAEAFEEEGISPAAIKGGLKACRSKFDWPPSCAEFIKACKPAVDPMTAYYEAIAGVKAREKGEVGNWSHPAVYWAAISVSAFDLKNSAYSQIRGRWEQALSEQMAKEEWPAIPAAMIALPAPGRADLSAEEAVKRIAELRAGDVLKTAASKTDHKLWAKHIMERLKRGDKTLSMIQIQFAKDALANTEAA
jgi:hypothetical protein